MKSMRSYAEFFSASLLIVIIMHGSLQCIDSARARTYLDEVGVKYEWHDIDLEQDSYSHALMANGFYNGFPFNLLPESISRFIRKLTRTRPRIPVIVFPDGTVLIEPKNEDLARKLNKVKHSLD